MLLTGCFDTFLIQSVKHEALRTADLSYAEGKDVCIFSSSCSAALNFKLAFCSASKKGCFIATGFSFFKATCFMKGGSSHEVLLVTLRKVTFLSVVLLHAIVLDRKTQFSSFSRPLKKKKFKRFKYHSHFGISLPKPPSHNYIKQSKVERVSPP